jgi:hypothetical protein
MLNIDPSLIVNEATPIHPRTGLLERLQTSLLTVIFGLLTASYFCNTTTPTTPTLSQEWNGVAGTSGITK